MDLSLSAKHFSKGQYLEGVCEALLASGHTLQAIPQLKVLEWKWKYNPNLTAELKQNERGFVYLDIPDEYVHSLFELCDDPKAQLPPYFGENRSGAHISVILTSEMLAKNGLTIADVGKKFTFRIAQMNSVKPDGWNEVDKVYFLTLSCPELESVRQRHGFSPKIQDHDFHLTFGICKV